MSLLHYFFSPIRARVWKGFKQRIKKEEHDYKQGCKAIDDKARMQKEGLLNDSVNSILKFLN